MDVRSKSRLRGVMEMRKKIKKKPMRYVNRYIRHVKGKLQVRSSTQTWSCMGYSHRLLPRFGKLRGLWRCHWLLSNVLQSQIEGEQEFAAAFVCQTLKCLHQVALDQGAWHTGHLMIPLEDPLAAEEFGGSPEELMIAQQYRTALADLRKTGKGKKGDEGNES